MTNMPFDSIDDYRDIETLRHHAEAIAGGADPGALMDVIRQHSRDNARTPMQWDSSAHGGFTTGTPWIAVNPNHTTINAAAAVADEHSVFHHYRRLIALRKADDVIATGRYELLFGDVPGAYVYRRFLDASSDDAAAAGEIVVVANCSSGRLALDLPVAWLDSRVVLWSHGLDATTLRAALDSDPQRPTPTALAPWESFVVRLAAPTPNP